MPTLTGLTECAPHSAARRERDPQQYRNMLAVWQRVRERWPRSAEEAGAETLLYAVALAFFYKGQTDYPDFDQAEELRGALSRCAGLDPRGESSCAEVLAELLRFPGIRLARASVLLHCLHPAEFPIVDRNAAAALCAWAETGTGWPEGVPRPTASAADMTGKVSGYLEYRRVILSLVAASQGRLSVREVELALYTTGRAHPPKTVTGL